MKLLESGHAYQAGGAVYFDVSSYERFGQIGHLSRATMLEYAAERGLIPAGSGSPSGEGS